MQESHRRLRSETVHLPEHEGKWLYYLSTRLGSYQEFASLNVRSLLWSVS